MATPTGHPSYYAPPPFPSYPPYYPPPPPPLYPLAGYPTGAGYNVPVGSPYATSAMYPPMNHMTSSTSATSSSMSSHTVYNTQQATDANTPPAPMGYSQYTVPPGYGTTQQYSPSQPVQGVGYPSMPPDAMASSPQLQSFATSIPPPYPTPTAANPFASQTTPPSPSPYPPSAYSQMAYATSPPTQSYSTSPSAKPAETPPPPPYANAYGAPAAYGPRPNYPTPSQTNSQSSGYVQAVYSQMLAAYAAQQAPPPMPTGYAYAPGYAPVAPAPSTGYNYSAQSQYQKQLLQQQQVAQQQALQARRLQEMEREQIDRPPMYGQKPGRYASSQPVTANQDAPSSQPGLSPQHAVSSQSVAYETDRYRPFQRPNVLPQRMEDGSHQQGYSTSMGYNSVPQASTGNGLPAPAKPYAMHVAQICGLPFNQVKRSILDVKCRCPRLQMASDFQSLICHYADSIVVNQIPTKPGVTVDISLNYSMPYTTPVPPPEVSEDDFVYTNEGDKVDMPLRHFVRIMLLTSSPKVDGGRHLCHRLNFVMLRNSKGSSFPPGGQYCSELDGPDPYDDATLKKTACRFSEAQMNVDLTGCSFHRFVEIFYESGSVRTRVVFLVPDVWNAKESFKACVQMREEIVKYTEPQEEDVPMTEEDVVDFMEEWHVALTKERMAAEADVPGERELDRLERLQEFYEAMKAKEANPPAPPKTKKIIVRVEKQNVIKHCMLKPSYISLIELAECHQARHLSREDFAAVFEVKLFALCFDEMLRLKFAPKVIEWLKAYPLRKAEEAKEKEDKRRREEEEIEVRAAKRRRKEERQQRRLVAKVANFIVSELETLNDASDAAEQSEAPPTEAANATDTSGTTESPAPGSTQEQPSSCKVAKQVEEDENASEDEAEEEHSKPRTRVTLVEDKEEMEPLSYFDGSTNFLSHFLHIDRLEALLLTTGHLCYREVLELLKPLAPLTGGSGQFNYAMACTRTREEVIPEPEPPSIPTADPVVSAVEDVQIEVHGEAHQGNSPAPSATSDASPSSATQAPSDCPQTVPCEGVNADMGC